MAANPESCFVDYSRVIVHFDCDAFYAQCEELRDPSLKTKPLGVTQKYLIVTANYPARQRGVAKLMSIKEAQQRCPELTLINGEDLTPYRKASKRVLSVLQRFGTAEKLGMDEVVVDVTEEVCSRLALGSTPTTWVGHLHRSEFGVVQENRHRVMDLRAHSAMSDAREQHQGSSSLEAPWRLKLMVGSHIAAEARAALKVEAGFRSSAGISCNRMLAKLSSGLHKPDDQTVLPPTEAASFLGPLPLRAIPGVGTKLGAELKELGMEAVQDLLSWSKESLVLKFGDRIGSFLSQACRGQDPTPVKAKQPPKAITVEDSFKSCTSLDAVQHVLQILAPDLLARLREEFQEEGRQPRTLILKWRHRHNGWSRNSSSCQMPTAVQVQKQPDESQVAAVVTAATSLFTRNVSGPFVLTLLNLGATNFAASNGGSKGSIPAAFSRLLQGPEAAATQALPPNQAGGKRKADQLTHSRRDYGAAPPGLPISKTRERSLRELERHGVELQPASETSVHEREEEEEPPALLAAVPIARNPRCFQSTIFCRPQEAPSGSSATLWEGKLEGGEHINVRQISQLERECMPQQPAETDTELQGLPSRRAEANSETKGICRAPQGETVEVQKHDKLLAGKLGKLATRGENQFGLGRATVAEEICRLKSLLRSQPPTDLDSDAALARRLQEDELGIGRKTGSSSKRKQTRRGPLDSFFLKNKKCT